MMIPEEIKYPVFDISGDDEFNVVALEIFHYQYDTNSIYREFVKHLGKNPDRVSHYTEIPFLPVSLFRDQMVVCGNDDNYEKVFTSSGTTGTVPSQHYVRSLDLYKESFTRSFSRFYGDPSGYRFLALLPGYLERQGSSLVYMMDWLINLTKQNGSGFFLHDMHALKEKLGEKASLKNTILFGASYGLLDFAELYPMDLSGVTIMETGGMKGRRREMIREELHEVFCRNFNVEKIHSEYGMTELLSQAYSQGDGIFRTPPWMKVLARDANDPLQILQPGQTGGISIIDLANVNSCSFISTQDLGKFNEDGSFEILGRFDDSDIRGCNLLVVQ
jgi:phenylacetate-coenzyme A ligase PaaK-like adenylate-forming protein